MAQIKFKEPYKVLIATPYIIDMIRTAIVYTELERFLLFSSVMSAWTPTTSLLCM